MFTEIQTLHKVCQQGCSEDNYKESDSQNQVVILRRSRKIEILLYSNASLNIPPSAVFLAKPIWQHKKKKTKKETNIIKIHISIKGQHKVKGESSSIREAEETRIWTMYLNATSTCFRHNDEQTAGIQKKTNQKEGDPLSYTEQYIQTRRERTRMGTVQ